MTMRGEVQLTMLVVVEGMIQEVKLKNSTVMSQVLIPRHSAPVPLLS
jgi:hypothetical protein